MRTGLVPLASWGIALIVIALMGRLVFGLTALPTLLLAGAGAGSVGTGVASSFTRRRRAKRPSEEGPHMDPELSLSAVAVAAGGSLALVGVGAGGAAFFWPGLGLAALGAGGLMRETLAGREELAALDERDRGGEGPG